MRWTALLLIVICGEGCASPRIATLNVKVVTVHPVVAHSTVYLRVER